MVFVRICMYCTYPKYLFIEAGKCGYVKFRGKDGMGRRGRDEGGGCWCEVYLSMIYTTYLEVCAWGYLFVVEG